MLIALSLLKKLSSQTTVRSYINFDLFYPSILCTCNRAFLLGIYLHTPFVLDAFKADFFMAIIVLHNLTGCKPEYGRPT